MTGQRIVPAPIRKTLRVKASRDRAFEIFTARMGGWWAKEHSVGAQVHQSPQADVVIEPRVGGRWYEVSENGAEYDWGRVLAWEPPARLVLAWQLTAAFEYEAGFETEVEVTFAQEGDETVCSSSTAISNDSGRCRNCSPAWMRAGGCCSLGSERRRMDSCPIRY